MPELSTRILPIEGGDGAGKETQSKMLFSHVTLNLGRNAIKEHFPRYDHKSSDIVRRYLGGEFGDLNTIPPEFVAYAYAADRRAGTFDIEQHLAASVDNLAIFDRYTSSNAAYQGAKHEDCSDRKAFYEWLFRMEWQDLRIPKPAKNLLLLVPPDFSVQKVIERGNGQDLHESNLEYLWRVSNAYHELSQLYPDEYVAIDCMDMEGKMRTRDDIQSDVRAAFEL